MLQLIIHRSKQKFGILDVIDADTATCVDMNFNLGVSDDELGVFKNIDSRSKVTK